MKKRFFLFCMLAVSITTAFADKTIYVGPTASGTGTGDDADNACTFATALANLDETGVTTFSLAPNSTILSTSGGGTMTGRILIPDGKKIIIEGNNATIDGTGSSSVRIMRIGASANVQIKNVTFINGSHPTSLGGAIFFVGDSLNISGCVFDNNSADNGGALGSRGKYIKISNSWFKNNKLLNSYQGAAISHTGLTTGGSLVVDNSTFSNNTGKTGSACYGTAIITAFDGSTRNYLNTVSITNCTFYKNMAGINTTAGYAAVQLDFLGTTAPTGTVTTASFVNNTFYGNSDAAINIKGKQQAVRLVNNVLVGDAYDNISGLGKQDHGFITEYSIAEGRPAVVAKNNYIVAKTPKSGKVDDTSLQAGNPDNNTLVTIGSQADIDALYLSTALQTIGSPVPYLAVASSSSPLVEGGISTVAGVVIPSTDIKGVTRASDTTGTKFDIGVYEFDGLTTGGAAINEAMFSVKQLSNGIYIDNQSDKTLRISVILPNGQQVYSEMTATSTIINRELFQKGLLIVVVSDGVSTIAHKVIN